MQILFEGETAPGVRAVDSTPDAGCAGGISVPQRESNFDLGHYLNCISIQ